MVADAHRINDSAEGARVVIIGSSFIGMEAAAAIAKRAKSVDVIGMEKVPFERVLGSQLGERFQTLHQVHGVRFHMERTVARIHDNGSGGVAAVELDNGTKLDADLCIVGAGVVPTTSFIKGVELQRDRSLLCDATLSVANCDALYAAGDVARFPYVGLDGETIRVEHYGYAQTQGRVCAANIAGKRTEMTAGQCAARRVACTARTHCCITVPFFWTAQFGKNLRYAGHALGYDDVIIDGDLEALKFLAVYARGDDVLAVASMGRDKETVAAAELLGLGKMPPASAWKNLTRRKTAPDLVQLLKDTQ